MNDVEFRAFIEQARGPLRNLALGLSGNSSDADDLVQATLEKLISAWRIRTPDEPWSYARATLTRTFISQRRRARWRREQLGNVPEQAAHAIEAAASGLSDNRIVLQRALDQLPARQRQAVVLRYLEDLPLREVADLMRCSEGNVKRCAHDGLAALRSHLHIEYSPEGASHEHKP